MRCYLLFFFGSVFGAPQGYEYKRPIAVLENINFQTIEAPKFLPCTHTKIFNGKLLNQQSEARIVNHKSNHDINQNLVTSESGYNYQSHTSFVGNDGNILTQSIPHQIAEYVPNFGHSGTVQQIQPTVQSQGYNYNQVTSNTASSVAAHHNLLSSHFISSGQNIENPNTPAYSTLSLNNPEVLGINFPNLRPDESFNGGITKDHDKAGYSHVTSTVHSASSNKNIPQISNGLLTGGNEHFVSISGNTAFNQDAVDKNIQYVPIVGSQLNSNALNGQLGQVIRETFANASLDPKVEKHIYVHVPPEDDDEEYQQKIVLKNQIPPRKHYKIIFIKAPSYPTPDYSQLANAVAPQVDEKTIVYVLVKKPEVPTLEQIQQLQQSSFKANKPEVYFIKYKTRKEGESNQYATNPQNGIYTDSNIHINGSGPDDIIDIRSGGEENAEGLSTFYSPSPSETITNNELKHELYGVPLQ